MLSALSFFDELVLAGYFVGFVVVLVGLFAIFCLVFLFVLNSSE